jgi:hypothetical protein
MIETCRPLMRAGITVPTKRMLKRKPQDRFANGGRGGQRQYGEAPVRRPPRLRSRAPRHQQVGLPSRCWISLQQRLDLLCWRDSHPLESIGVSKTSISTVDKLSASKLVRGGPCTYIGRSLDTDQTKATLMARTLRDTTLDTRAARSRLRARGKPYYRAIEEGLRRASG